MRAMTEPMAAAHSDADSPSSGSPVRSASCGRVRLEISAPLRFCVMSALWNLLEWQYKARNPKT